MRAKRLRSAAGGRGIGRGTVAALDASGVAIDIGGADLGAPSGTGPTYVESSRRIRLAPDAHQMAPANRGLLARQRWRLSPQIASFGCLGRIGVQSVIAVRRRPGLRSGFEWRRRTRDAGAARRRV